MERLKLDIQKQTLLDELAEGGKPLSPEDRYLCARFVRQLAKDKPEFVPHMARLASIGLLTDVIEDFVKPTAPEARSDLTLILDAPVALNLLGLSGNAARDDIRNVVEALRGIGCSFLALPVSCDEMNRNLSSMLRLPAPDRHGPTHDAMRKGEVQEAYVRSVMNDPEQALATVGVTVRPVDLTTYPASTRFFSEELYEGFFGGIRWKQDSIDARQHDAVCAAITMRLRAGQRSSDVLRSRFVFVSTNPRFARYARDFCVDSRLVGPNHVPPVVLQRELATTAWLRTGFAGQAGERITRDIPRSHLIASCERVLKTRREVVQAVHRTLKEFAPDRLVQYELMLSDQRSVQRLMDETLGEERLVNADNAERLLEEMRRATAQEVEGEYRRKMRDQKRALTAKAQAEQELAEAARLAQQAALNASAVAQREASAAMLRDKEREIAERDELLAAAEHEKASLQAQIQEAIRRERERASLIMGQVSRTSRRVELISLAILWGAVATGFFATTLGMEGPANWVVRWIGLPLALIAAYHFVQEVRQKPKIGLQTMLNALARRTLRRRLRQTGIDAESILVDAMIENGKVSWKGNVSPPSHVLPPQVTGPSS